MDSDLPKDPAPQTPSGSRVFRRFVLFFVLPTVALLLFYPLENQRGEKAWLLYKKEMEARGEHLDFDFFIPPPVPDDENICKVPLVEGWCSRTKINPTIQIPETGRLSSDWENAKPTELAEWVKYFYSDVVSNYLAEQAKLDETIPKGEVYPLITMEEAPLIDAVKNLVRETGLTVDFEPRITDATNAPTITLRWENVTPRQALLMVLENFNLKAVPDPSDPTNNLKRLIVINTNSWYNEQLLLGSIASTNSLLQQTNGTEVIPLITMEDAPRPDAIRTLARQAGINFQFDSTLLTSSEFYEKTVTLRRENMASRDVLAELLEELNLTAIPNQNGIYRITRRVKTAGEILKAFEKFEPQFKELYAACAKPRCRFDIDYKDLSQGGQFFYMGNFRYLAQSLALRASAELALQKNAEALQDIKTSIRFADCLTNSSLVGGMIQTAMDRLVIGPVWEGVASRRWNDEQLTELQNALAQIDLIPNLVRSLRSERAYGNFVYLSQSTEGLSKLLDYSQFMEEALPRQVKRVSMPYVPRGWIYQNLITINRHYQEGIDTIDTDRAIISPTKVNSMDAKIEAQLKVPTPYNFVSSITSASYSRAIRTVAEAQIFINQAVTACALERYRLAHGSFPETLEALTPKFLSQLPHDVINGEPLKYHLTDDGQYVLYSVGWNEKDDNGQPSADYWRDNTGDWVWRFPVRKERGL